MKSLYVKFAVITIMIMIISSLISFMLSNFYYQQKLKPYNDEKNTEIALEIANYIKNEKNIEVRFQDSGIGLTEETKERIFERFYREDSARSRTIEGTGLGLSIVLSIVRLHNGHLQVDSKKNVGSIFTVYLPKI